MFISINYELYFLKIKSIKAACFLLTFKTLAGFKSGDYIKAALSCTNFDGNPRQNTNENYMARCEVAGGVQGDNPRNRREDTSC